MVKQKIAFLLHEWQQERLNCFLCFHTHFKFSSMDKNDSQDHHLVIYHGKKVSGLSAVSLSSLEDMVPFLWHRILLYSLQISKNYSTSLYLPRDTRGTVLEGALGNVGVLTEAATKIISLKLTISHSPVFAPCFFSHVNCLISATLWPVNLQVVS